ncbi:MAG: hypothetical protein H0W69_04690 [Gemmatimonadaceae bacterium]|nr:hypothetical protein [Gemmatimonadaceae bacterium]
MQTNNLPASAGQTAPAAPEIVTSPTTIEEIGALRARREELSNQLISAAGRRKSLATELRGASGADKVGLEQRIGVLDQRMVQLESDIATTGRQLTSAPAGLVAIASESSGPRAFDIFTPAQFTALSIIFTVFVLFPLSLSAARLMWRRAKQPITVPAIQGEAAQRLERLEQSVEAVAIEVERISEGQRFVTRLLSATPQAGILPSQLKETVAVKISD